MEHTARRVVMTRIVTTSAREPPSGAMRLVVLLALVAVALCWLQHHIGFQFAKLGVIAAATTAWTAIEKIRDVLGQKSAMSATQERAVRPLRSALRLASRPGPLGVIAVLLVIPMVFLTTVTVTSEQTVSDPTKVSISALDSRAGLLEDSLTGRRALARFFVVTNPFGRLFRISARGYLPTALVVYPPVGRNVVL